jgi:hypothetical protein
MKLYRRKSTGEIHDGTKVVGVFCGRCAGTGQFVTMVVNGKPTGPGGECYRCQGKGYQTPEDEKRNDAFDEWSAVNAIRQDLRG